MDWIELLARFSDVDVIIFAAIAIVGLVMLLASFLLGEVFDLLGDFNLEVAGVDFSNIQTVLAFVTGFGAVAWICTGYFQLNAGVSSLIGLGGGVTLAIPIAVAYRFLRKQQATSGYSVSDLIGTTALVDVAIPANGLGTIRYSYAGRLGTSTATSSKSIPAGVQVKIASVVGGAIVVEPVAEGSAG